MATVYKGAYLPTPGGDVGTWGASLNTDTFAVFDSNLGGIVSVSMAAGDVSLSAAQSRNAILRLTGVLTANQEVTTACQGFTLVENVTTGAFDVTFANGVGTPVTLPRGQRCVVITDATNGPRIVAKADPFPSGTAMVFVQTTAPTGWTKVTTTNNAALRLVSGTASSGGTADFTTVFASHSPTGTTDGHALTIAEMPLHGHPTRLSPNPDGSVGASGGLTMNAYYVDYAAYTGTPDSTAGHQIGGEGGGDAHTHTFTATAIDFAVKYVDVIYATKD